MSPAYDPNTSHCTHTERSRTKQRQRFLERGRNRAGKLSHGCIAWLLGLPLPIVILALLWRGCD